MLAYMLNTFNNINTRSIIIPVMSFIVMSTTKNIEKNIVHIIKNIGKNIVYIIKNIFSNLSLI